MRAVGSVVVVEAFPDRQLLLEIHVISIGEQLVELVLVPSVGSLDLPVKPRGSQLENPILASGFADA